MNTNFAQFELFTNLDAAATSSAVTARGLFIGSVGRRMTHDTCLTFFAFIRTITSAI